MVFLIILIIAGMTWYRLTHFSPEKNMADAKNAAADIAATAAGAAAAAVLIVKDAE